MVNLVVAPLTQTVCVVVNGCVVIVGPATTVIAPETALVTEGVQVPFTMQ